MGSHGGAPAEVYTSEVGTKVDPAPVAEPPRRVAARVLLLHSGGALWVDALGMHGPRVTPFVRWLPTSAQAELGLVPDALSTLPFLQGGAAARLSHFALALSAGDAPSGSSGQVAVALAALWFWAASRRGAATARPLGAPVSTDRILAATGRIVERAGADGLFHYDVGPVGEIDAKVAALAARRAEATRLDLVVPMAQTEEAQDALLRHFPDAVAGAAPRTWRLYGGWIRLLPVADLEDLQDVVEVVCAEIPVSPPASATLEPGAVLAARFTLAAPLGEGGAACVWRAVDGRDGAEVAVKVLHPHIARDPARLAAFYRGARHMERLAGTGVARIVHSPGGDGPHRFIALALLDGGTLHDAVLCGRAERHVETIRPLAEILGRAHAAGVVHRDVKPTNILLDGDGRLVLVDFDLAGVLDARRTTTRTLGSLAYCAPEILSDGARAATPASDVYGLAMTAVFVLHGAELPVAALRAPRDFLEAIAAPAPVKWALAAALAPDPSARPRDAAALGRALDDARALGDRGRRYVGPGRRRVARGATWTRRLGMVAAALAVLLIGGRAAYQTAVDEAGAARKDAVHHRLAERAWRLAESRPAEALATLRAAGALDATSAARLLSSGGASRVLEAPSKVLAVAVSPDGQRVAAGVMGGDVVVWDVATGAEAWRAPTRVGRVNGLRFTPDGRALAAWAADATLREEGDASMHAFDAQTGAPVDLFTASGSPIDVSFGTHHALTQHRSRTVRWDRRTGLPTHETSHLPDRGYAAPDGHTIVTLDGDVATVHRVDGDVTRASGFQSVGRPGWSADSARFALGTPTHLRVHDVADLVLSAVIPVGCHHRLVLDETGRRAVCGGAGTDAALVHVDTGAVHPLEHGARLSTATFVDALLVTTTFDGGIRVWDGERGVPIVAMGGHAGLISAAAIADGRTLVTGGLDGTVRLWALDEVVSPHEIVARGARGDPALHPEHVAWRDAAGGLWLDGRSVGRAGDARELSFSTDGRWLIATGQRDSALWRADGAHHPLGRFARRAAVSGGEPARVAVVDERGDLHLGGLDASFRRLGGPTPALMAAIAWTPDDAHLLAFPYTGEVVVRDADGQPVSRLLGLTEGVTRYRFTGDGGLVAGTWSSHVGIWDIATGAPRVAHVGHVEEVVAVDLSADGRLVVSGSWDDTARVWRVGDGSLQVALAPGGGDVIDVAFSPDGARVATLTNDRLVRLFDVADGTLVAVQPGSRARQIAWDQRGLITAEVDGSVRRWRPAERPPEGWDAYAGGRTNLRVCADDHAVVAVTPWPDPSSTWAPASACVGVRAATPPAPG